VGPLAPEAPEEPDEPADPVAPISPLAPVLPVGPAAPVAPVAPRTLPVCEEDDDLDEEGSELSFEAGIAAAWDGRSLCDPLRIPAIWENSRTEDRSTSMTNPMRA